MQPSTISFESRPPYEDQSRAAALHWSQLELSASVPEFDILSIERQDFRPTILDAHRLTAEHRTRRWCGRVVAGSNDIVCSTREAFDEGLKKQWLLALYHHAARDDLEGSVACAPYPDFRNPSYRPVGSQRFLYHQLCDDCHAIGTRTCHNCRGEGEQICSACAGDANQTCGPCEATGQVKVSGINPNVDDHPKPGDCSDCSGRSNVHCYGCGGNGRHACDDCQRAGVVPCTSCESIGSFTDVGQIDLVRTPTYPVTFDDGTSGAFRHVVPVFATAEFVKQVTARIDSVIQN